MSFLHVFSPPRFLRGFCVFVLPVLRLFFVRQVPPHCAKELFRTARDMLDLFRAVGAQFGFFFCLGSVTVVVALLLAGRHF